MRWVVAIGAVLLLSGCRTAAPATPVSFGAPHAVGDRARLVVVGDVQRTAPILEFFREQNDAERALVVSAIAAERPDLVAFTGDCVFDGGSDAQWEAFDRLMQPIHAAGIPAIAAFGNHEWWLGRDGESHLFARFPHLRERHWYAVIFGPLRLVVLDSNEGRLGDDEEAEQLEWYDRTLARFDADPGVRGVFVLFHHPPFTNSTVTGDEAHVQRALLPPFLRAKKTLAMLNGHVHNYERFTRDGKMLVVSGGGGGPRAKLLQGDERRHKDDLFDGPALRDFHFTVYTLTETGVRAEVRGVPKGRRDFRVIDRFEMPWAR